MKRSKLIASRKGFELQFNWMFVLIAGSIFLIFFFLVIRGQLSNSEEDSSLQAQADLGFILRSSQGSRESEKKIPFGARINFKCSDSIPSYDAPKSGFAEDYPYLVLFAPKFIEAPHVLLKTMSLKLPFSASSFSYLTTNQVNYVFLDESAQSKSLFTSLPESSTRSFNLGSVSLLSDENFDTNILIIDSINVSSGSVISSFLTNFDEKRYASINLVEYAPTGGIVGSYGIVKFYNYSDVGFNFVGESYYITPAQLLGAVYSGSFELYTCEADKIKARIGLIADLYSKKADYFLGVYPECSAIYTTMGTELAELKDASDEVYTLASAQRMFEASQRLQALNLRLVDTTDCALLY